MHKMLRLFFFTQDLLCTALSPRFVLLCFIFLPWLKEMNMPRSLISDLICNSQITKRIRKNYIYQSKAFGRRFVFFSPFCLHFT